MWYWEYYPGQELMYGDEESYLAAAKFLTGKVEDWGCGAAWARRYFKDYVGVDAAPGPADVVANLCDRRSDVDSILLRHVLEHNLEWEKILTNALASCRQLALVIFTPFADQTYVRSREKTARGTVPNISFAKADLTKHFTRYDEVGFPKTGETMFMVSQ